MSQSEYFYITQVNLYDSTCKEYHLYLDYKYNFETEFTSNTGKYLWLEIKNFINSLSIPTMTKISTDIDSDREQYIYFHLKNPVSAPPPFEIIDWNIPINHIYQWEAPNILNNQVTTDNWNILQSSNNQVDDEENKPLPTDFECSCPWEYDSQITNESLHLEYKSLYRPLSEEELLQRGMHDDILQIMLKRLDEKFPEWYQYRVPTLKLIIKNRCKLQLFLMKAVTYFNQQTLLSHPDTDIKETTQQMLESINFINTLLL